MYLNWAWEGWEALAAIATCALAGSLFVAIWQIRQAKKGTNAQVAVELFKELRGDETLEKLRFIYKLKPDEIKKLAKKGIGKDKEKHKNIDHVLDRLELLGALVNQGIIDERLAIEAYGGPPVLKCWHQLGKNYIKKIRNDRGLFCKHVENFAKHTTKYQLKHAPRDEWIHFLKEIPPKLDDDKVNLVEEFKKSKLLSRRERCWCWFIRHFRHPCISYQEYRRYKRKA